VIEFRASDIHGSGGFATAPIAADTTIIEYVGEKIDKQESARRCEANNPYIFHLDDQFDLDGAVDWNPARLLNHSCSPNCEARMDEDNRIWIMALRDIAPGEEITFNYGYDMENWRDHPCRCGSPDCVGYIVAEEYQASVKEMAANIKDAQTSSQEMTG
jgi:SET domain-containing protein